jgi:tetratricopeptide (TPR) repeat protein
VAEAQESVVKIKADLEKAKGPDRARLLDKLVIARTTVSRFVPDKTLPDDVEKWSKEIVALDPQNKTGLKKKYEFRVLMMGSEHLLAKGKGPDAQETLDKALALAGLTGEEIQEARFLQGRGRMGQKDVPGAIECFRKALDAAPSGPLTPILKIFIQRCESQLAKQKSAKPDEKK